MSIKLNVVHCLDAPDNNEAVDPLAIHLEGWVRNFDLQPPIVGINVRLDGQVIAETDNLFLRPEVNETCGFPPNARCGFAMLGYAPAAIGGAAGIELVLHARLADGTEPEFDRRTVRPIATDYRTMPYGALLQSHFNRHRERHEIYGSGPSNNATVPATMSMLKRYLPLPPHRILDVGCGFGGYGKILLADGYDWFGVEVDEGDCAELTRRGLPHQRIQPGAPLPFVAGAFDTAIAVEVLEHVPQPDTLLAEMARAATNVIVSVPNLELLPYLAPYRATPWHMLEGDHKNFFNRWSLRALLGRHYRHVEVFSYSPMPLRTPEGCRLDYHLFGVARA